MGWKEKVDEAAERLHNLVEPGKYDIEVDIPKKGERAVHVKSKRPMNHIKKWMARNR